MTGSCISRKHGRLSSGFIHAILYTLALYTLPLKNVDVVTLKMGSNFDHMPFATLEVTHIIPSVSLFQATWVRIIHLNHAVMSTPLCHIMQHTDLIIPQLSNKNV